MSETPPPPPAANAPAEREWWDDPNLPWKHKPTRSDLACWAWISAAGIYGLAMIPLRAWLLTVPYISALLNGSRAALVAVGAFITTRHDPVAWWLPTMLFAALSALKWDWLYWWAGKLWGHALIDTWTASKPRYKALALRLERLARRHPFLALALTYLPIPLVQVVYVVLGAAGLKLRTFLLLDYVIALANAVIWVWVGAKIGPPAVHVLQVYSKYATYVGLALLVIMLVTVWRRAGREPEQPLAAEPPLPDES